MSIVNKHIPSKSIKHLKPKNPFVTPAIETAIKDKRAALRRLKRENTETNRETFKKLRNRVTHLLRKSERAHATSLLRTSKLQPSPTSSRNFWHHMKAVQGKVQKTIIPTLTPTDQSKRAETSLEKAELLNDFFCRQTVLPGALTSNPDSSSLENNVHTLESFCTTPREVYDHLSRLKTGKGPGIDNLSPGLLKMCAVGISASLATLFNRSFDSSSFPTDWKLALVVPIFKKGAKDLPGNYRPISLLPILSKVLEKIVHKKIVRFLRPWLSPNQSGFKEADGTSLQLMRIVQEWSTAVDQGKYVGTVFFDLCKAFDRVWHRGLLVNSKLPVSAVKPTAGSGPS